MQSPAKCNEGPTDPKLLFQEENSVVGKIVAIGGGDLSSLETLEIDREIISLTGKSRPKALFIPTASGDSVERWHEFESVYRGRLGCDTDFLYLLGVTPTPSELKEKILSSDLIFVGGGNTLKMMRRWRRLGVDRVLRSAHDKGIVLCGVSAGAICWFTHGHSDSMSFYSSDSWSYIRVKGMGLIDAFACPHYDSETAGVRREQDFHNMVTKHGGMGIAIDNHCAIELVDDGYRVITSRPGAGAYRVYKRAGHIVREAVEQRRDFSPTSELLRRPR